MGVPVKVGEIKLAFKFKVSCKSVCAERVPVIKPQEALAGGELCQEAKPVASVATKTFPGPGIPPEIVIVPPIVALLSAISGPSVRSPPTTIPPPFCCAELLVFSGGSTLFAVGPPGGGYQLATAERETAKTASTKNDFKIIFNFEFILELINLKSFLPILIIPKLF